MRRSVALLLSVGLLLFPFLFFAQRAKPEKFPLPTAGTDRLTTYQQIRQEPSLVHRVPFRNVGPVIMSGRVVDVEVNPENPVEFYVAYASGGLWYTTNNGMSFIPVFDYEAVLTIGDILADWKRGLVWVGTGENNSSRSSYSGVGIYRGTVGGTQWTYCGLPESHHIGRIIQDYSQPGVLLVAVLGHLYSENPERGLYRSTDDGITWTRVLSLNDTTGCIDVIQDPNDPAVFYAASWQRWRRAWHFEGSGPGSGIYRSADGGLTWKRITLPGSGFPVGAGTGRIGLAVLDTDSSGRRQSTLIALVDNLNFREKKAEDTTVLTKSLLRNMDAAAFLRQHKDRVETFLRQNRFPAKYTADTVRLLMQKGIITPQTLVEFLEDANSLLFDSEVIGAEVYRSSDGGRSWQRTHTGYLDDFFYTYGYYFAQVRTLPGHPHRIYLLGFVLVMSDDGGKTFKKISNEENVHVDHHALWVNPRQPGHLISGNDGGVNITYDNGRNWIKCNNPPVGQFYTVAYDMSEPYRVFGGLQDNGVWYGPSTYSPSVAWHQTGQYSYKEIMGGDGMQVAVDTRTNATVYTGYQFGNYFRINLVAGSQQYITPQHELGQRPYRWNWQSPITLSQHNQSIVYFGANLLFRSLNQGNDFKPISPDLTGGGRKGNVPYGTLTSISESPLRFGLIYAGTDNGRVWVSRDGGTSWNLITPAAKDLPPALWVSRVWASPHKEERVYVALNGYRWDHFKAYVLVSNDYGKTWKRLGTDLPDEPVNVVKDDPVNENVVYVGTDQGCYVSLNGGQRFMPFSSLPRVAVHDLCIHPRERELILGTHGRSIYIGRVKELQQLTDSVLNQPLFVFAADPVRHEASWGKRRSFWDTVSVPRVLLAVYADEAKDVQMEVFADSALMVFRDAYRLEAGLNYLPYALRLDSAFLQPYEDFLNRRRKPERMPVRLQRGDDGQYYLQPGTFRLRFSSGAVAREINLEIKP
ncbi:MAG: hypothetical protein RMK52_02255 [Chitinophagales bacterium]|nr:hypothetical protein [Chitinophagales bacterium]MDW8393047.1 hypothetical protein [Chitinophagales bacterium]